MELYLCRAMEVCRMGVEDLIRLHVKEKNIGHCLNPHEIQESFNLCPLKEEYEIPDHDPSMSAHNQRLRGEFRKANLMPRHGDFIMTDLIGVHEFDEKAIQASNRLDIHLDFQGGNSGKKKLSEDL